MAELFTLPVSTLRAPTRLVDPLKSESTSLGASRRSWTAKEDQALIVAVQRYGSCDRPGFSWAVIRGEVGGDRTNKDCRKRWFHTLDPSLRKGRWTTDEDAALRKAFAELGPQWKEMGGTWFTIFEGSSGSLIAAQRVPGRNDEQVAKRWKDVLSPGLTPDTPWTAEEDLRLLQLFEQHGPKWTLLSDSLAGRNGIACRNHFRRLRKSRRNLLEADSTLLPQITYPHISIAGISSRHGLDYLFPEQSHECPASRPQSIANSSANGDLLPFMPAAETRLVPPLCGDSETDVDRPHMHPEASSTKRQAPDEHALLFSWLFPESPTVGENTVNEQPRETNRSAPDPVKTHGVSTVHKTVDTAFNEEFWTSFPSELSTGEPSVTSEAMPGGSSFLVDTGPIRNVWSLLVALESGSETLTVTSGLVRQLLGDASRS